MIQPPPSAHERALARTITAVLFRTSYRNASVLKRLAALRAARTITETLKGGTD